MRKNDLPRGWTTATIPELVGAAGVFADGDWVESKDQDPKGDVRLIQLADVGDGTYRDRSARFLTSEKAELLSCTTLQAGDLLLARMPDPLGRACIFPGDSKSAVTVVDVCIIRTGHPGVDHRWIMGAVNSPAFRRLVVALQSGTTRRRISRKNLATLKLPLPPLPEQHRIVAEIDKQFTRLEAAVAALESAQTKLKRYRASVLKAACEGRLVPTEAELARAEGRNYEPAEVLLDRILKERRAKWEAEQLEKMKAAGKEPQDDRWKAKYREPSSPDIEGLLELPEGWTWATVEQVASAEERSIQSGPFGSALLHSEFQATGILALGIDNVLEGRFSKGSQNRISEKKFQSLQRFEARPLDVLVTVMATIGRCCVVPSDLGPALITKHVYRISPNQELVSPEYLMFSLWGAEVVREQMFREVRGQTRPGINGEILRRIALPLPPLAEQHRIVAEVERRLSHLGKLEGAVEQSLRRATRLRQSILKRAFEGKLVPQDPNDEPASVLLERIRSEREEEAVQAKPRRKSRAGRKPLMIKHRLFPIVPLSRSVMLPLRLPPTRRQW